MAYRLLEVTLQSAKDLKNVNFMTRMEVYAVATISGDPITRQCTPPDPYGGRYPTWNATLRFAVPPTADGGGSGCLHVVLRTERSRGDRDIGEVIVPLAEILAGVGYDLGPRPQQFAAYKVRKVHRAETRGVLYLSYRLGAVVAPHQRMAPHRLATRAAHDEPVVAYPVAQSYSYGPHSYDYMPVPALMPPPPPTPRASGHMSIEPASPQASGGHMAVSPPSSQSQAYGGHTAVPPPLPKAYGHLSMPPPPPQPPIQTSSGHMSMPATSPQKTSGYSAASPWTTARNNGNADFGRGHSAGGTNGGMMAGDMMSDTAAYNAGYRAGLTGEWGRAVY